jgi:hypothetical protein
MVPLPGRNCFTLVLLFAYIAFQAPACAVVCYGVPFRTVSHYLLVDEAFDCEN